MQNYVIQGIGIIGLILSVISFQKNSNKGILFYQIMSCCIFAVHFSLLGAFTGAAMNITGAARNIVFYNRENRWAQNKWWVGVFIAIYAILGILTWKNIFSVFPIIAMTLSTIGLWIKTPKITRLIVLPSSPCWMIYNIASHSIAGIMTEAFILSSLIIAFIRFDIRKPLKEVTSDEVK